MTAPIVQRLCEAAAALPGERVSMQTMAQAHGADRRSWTAVAIGLMAVIVVLPIPFGNLLPALALMLIGLGLVFSDGVAVVLGLATAGLALFVTAGLVLMAWVWGGEWIARWVST